MPVRRAQRLIRRRQPMCRSQRRRNNASGKITRRLPHRVRQGGLHDADFQILPLARLQLVDVRRQYPVRRVQTGIQVRHRDANLDRRRSLNSRETHHSTHALRDQIKTRTLRIRSRPTKSRYRAVDDTRIQLTHRVVIQTQSAHHPGPVVLDNHIRIGQHPTHRRNAICVLEVQNHAALVPVHRQECSRFPF